MWYLKLGPWTHHLPSLDSLAAMQVRLTPLSTRHPAEAASSGQLAHSCPSRRNPTWPTPQLLCVPRGN